MGRRRARVTGWLVALTAAMALAGCHKAPQRAQPPRITTVPELPQKVSTLVVPVTTSLATLQAALEARVPRELWSIDELRPNCVPAQRVKALGVRLKVTPDISCRIIGRVRRGPLRLTGAGQRINIAMPVSAVISARDIGGVLKGKTATGSAVVRATATLGLMRDWTPTAKVAIAYDWTDPPGIDFLGQRILLVRKADQELAGVIAGLERDLQGEIGRVKLRPLLADAWRQGFTVVALNVKNPPAWMRVTPVRAGVLQYAVENSAVVLTIAAEARMETFVGRKPEPTVPTPLPPQIAGLSDRGLRFWIPVTADYDQLEPVVLRALRRLNDRGISLKGLGRVNARFDKVTVFPTEGNRLAVGIDAHVEPLDSQLLSRWGKTKGRVWLTGEPVHDPNSEVIHIRDLNIFGETDSMATNLVLQLVASDPVRVGIAQSLTQDFGKDYARVLGSAKRAIADKRVGDFVLSVTVDTVHHEVVQVTGAGLFLPVEVTGKARIVFQPLPKRQVRSAR